MYEMLKYLYCLPLISPVYADLMRPPTVDAAPDERKKTLILGAAIILDGLVDREAWLAAVCFPFHDHRLRPELKGSVGEGLNHSNYSDQSSVRIRSESRSFY